MLQSTPLVTGSAGVQPRTYAPSWQACLPLDQLAVNVVGDLGMCCNA